MFTVVKKLEISASHQLKLTYPSKCQNLHGHNWIVHIHARAAELDENGMVIDFGHIKEAIHGQLDHKHVNDVMGDINPTAENMAKWIADQLGEKCFKVVVQESEGNVAIYDVIERFSSIEGEGTRQVPLLLSKTLRLQLTLCLLRHNVQLRRRSRL